MAAKFKACSIDGCKGNAHYSACGCRGWCGKHYQRWQRLGDPLAGGTFDGEPERYLSEVVLAYEGDECLPWPFGKSGGYGTIYIDGRSHLVHRRVCERVNGPPPTPEHDAAHSCGKGHEACCAKRHLSWKTHVGNMADKITHGTSNRGERHGSAKLTNGDVLAIRELQGQKLQREIAAQFGISTTCVSQIHRREIWGWL